MLFHHPAEYQGGQEKATERQGTWLISEEDSWQLEKDRRSLPPHVERFTIPTYARLDLNDTSQNIATLDRWLATIGNNRIWWSMNLKNIAKTAVLMVKQKIALLTLANFKNWKPLLEVIWGPCLVFHNDEKVLICRLCFWPTECAKVKWENNINQVDKFLLPLFSPRDEILSVSWEEFNVDDDLVFVALEGYLVCPEKLVGGPNWKRVGKIFLHKFWPSS